MAGPDPAPGKTEAKGEQRPEHRPPRPHGDKLGAATGAPAPASGHDAGLETADSPKRQGDPMAHLVRGKG